MVQPHRFFNNIIMLPEFEQARAKLECELGPCCLRARSAFEHRISQPPAPRGLERIGPERRAERVAVQELRFNSELAGRVAGFFVAGILLEDCFRKTFERWVLLRQRFQIANASPRHLPGAVIAPGR
jgi:hypothetical protein